jgi:hypothetical protein
MISKQIITVVLCGVFVMGAVSVGVYTYSQKQLPETTTPPPLIAMNEIVPPTVISEPLAVVVTEAHPLIEVEKIKTTTSIDKKDQPIKVSPIHMEWIADFSNDQYAVGFAHNVFVGKVVAQVGNKSSTPFPKTQFTTEVIYNIKGNLSGVVVVSQNAGYRDGVLRVMGDVLRPGGEDGGYLLESGVTYLFAALGPDKEGWYHLNSFPGLTKFLSTNADLSNEQLKSIATQDAQVKRWEAVYPNEITESPTSPNSFQSLPPEAKAAAQARADAAKISLDANTKAQ